MPILATGSKTIIDLSDGKSLSAYLGSNMPRVQILNLDNGVYTPNWTSSNLIVTPVVYANQTQIQLSDSNLTISWKRKVGTGNIVDPIVGESMNANKELVVTINSLSGAGNELITYIANIQYTDPDTSLPINAVADITFALVKNGLTGADGADAKTCKITGDQVFKYNGLGAVLPAQITLTATPVASTFSIWKYKNASSVWTNYPTGDGNAAVNTPTLIVKPGHAVFVNNVATIGSFTTDNAATPKDTISVYKVADGIDGEDGDPGDNASIAFLSNENITFAGNVSGQVAATTITCNVVAYTGTTKVTPTVGTVTGAVTGMTVTKLTAASNEIPIKIEIAANATLGGAGAQQGTLTVPIEAPVSTTLYIRWSKVNTGASAKNITISASTQTFKLGTNGVYAPTSINLTPVLANVTYGSWEYTVNNGTDWTPVSSGTAGLTINSGTLNVASGSSLFTASVSAITFRVIANDSTIKDVITIYRVQDGLPGLTAVLTNESHALPKTNTGDITYTDSGTLIRLFEGGTELTYDGVGTTKGTWKATASGGGTITPGAITDGGLHAIVANHSAMIGNTASVTYTITGTRLSGGAISLTKVQTLSTALQGAVGQNAIVFSLYTPNGNVFTNHTIPANLPIYSTKYDGNTVITTASYLWSKYVAGSWVDIAGAITDSLSVPAADVVGIQTYRCKMTYKSKDYFDTITLIDKTDNYQSTIDSTAGDVFKNTVGSTILISRVFQNGLEVDAVKSTKWGPSTNERPTTPATGDFYYQYANTAPTTASRPTTVWRWSGSAWVDVTANATYKHTLTYKWYRRNASGAPESGDGGGTGLFATGKLVYLDDSMVTDKAVITCEVE